MIIPAPVRLVKDRRDIGIIAFTINKYGSKLALDGVLHTNTGVNIKTLRGTT